MGTVYFIGYCCHVLFLCVVFRLFESYSPTVCTAERDREHEKEGEEPSYFPHTDHLPLPAPLLAHSSGEFVVMLLSMMGKVSEQDCLLAAQIFDKLDYNGDGTFFE